MDRIHLMNIKVFILFFIMTLSLKGQIIYEPIFINQCSGKIEDAIFSYVEDSINIYGFDNHESNIVSLPKSGYYLLHYDIGEEPIKIKVDDVKIFRDTFLLKSFQGNVLFQISKTLKQVK